MPRAFVFETARNQPKTGLIMGPVAKGLRSVGYEVEVRESAHYPYGDENKADVLAIWGDAFGCEKILRDMSSLRPRTCQIDNGFIDRRRYEGHYSLSYNARQCHNYLWSAFYDRNRWPLLNETIQPWRKDGNTILILAPSHKQGRFLGFDVHQWARQIHAQLSCYTKKRIVTRIKTYGVDKPLRDVLRDEPIFAAVGHSTKGLVDCLLYGIPVFNTAPCVIERMGLQDLSKIETPYYPENRQEFFERLAWHQFLLSEIAEGLPFQLGVMPCP